MQTTDIEMLYKITINGDRRNIQGYSKRNKQALLVSINNYSNENTTLGFANLPLLSALPPSGKPTSSITSDGTGSFDWSLLLWIHVHTLAHLLQSHNFV